MLWNFLLILLLVALNGFFVATEFAVITARKTRVRLQAEEGNAAAQQVLIWLENPQARDRLIAAAQLGITIAGYLLGHLDHIPVQGETVMLAGEVQLQVAAMDGLRISKIQIRGV